MLDVMAALAPDTALPVDLRVDAVIELDRQAPGAGPGDVSALRGSLGEAETGLPGLRPVHL